LLHLVGSSILLYLIDDARSNKNQDRSVLFAMSSNANIIIVLTLDK